MAELTREELEAEIERLRELAHRINDALYDEAEQSVDFSPGAATARHRDYEREIGGKEDWR